MKIGLLWHSFYSGNLGISALTDANMHIILEAAKNTKIEFIIFGPKGDTAFTPPKELSNIEYVEVSSITKTPHVWKKLRSCKYVFDIGAGDSFSDIYGWKRYIKISGLKVLARIAGCNVTLSPQTLGPFKSSLAKITAMLSLKACSKIFARDQLSIDRAREILGKNFEKKIELTTDVAFALPYSKNWPSTFPILEKNKIHIGINVSGLLFQGGYTNSNQFGLNIDYPSLIRTLLEELSNDTKYKIWLIPHVYQITRPTLESDRAVSEKLVQEFPSVSIAPQFLEARSAKTFLSQMNLVIAARMHAAIGAVSSGVACVPLSYSVKFQGLFASINYPYTIDMKSKDNIAAMNDIREAIADISTIKEKAIASSENAEIKLKNYRSFIENLLSDDFDPK